ncbi:MAG TPA: hypothetical protein DCE31_00625 [Lautropia sp.]|jgi:hypothetical protein|nr:hypothetical protein [Lautropia sp.]
MCEAARSIAEAKTEIETDLVFGGRNIAEDAEGKSLDKTVLTIASSSSKNSATAISRRDHRIDCGLHKGA